MISFLNFLYLKLIYPSVNLKGNRFFKLILRLSKGNNFVAVHSTLKNTNIHVKGNNNHVSFKKCNVSNTIVSISGKNNKITVEEGVILRKANIIIRGNSCSIIIKKKTTFGEVRMVNVGSSNEIYIGENCLFSDRIEIWASDTHAIYNQDGIWINEDKPIFIEDNVWVGSNVTILKGVTIKEGAIIGMGSIITKNVSEKTIVAGNPPREIKKNVTWSLNYPTKK